jgi:hypothetical protein
MGGFFFFSNLKGQILRLILIVKILWIGSGELFFIFHYFVVHYFSLGFLFIYSIDITYLN